MGRLIPRAILLSKSARSAPILSPDGQSVAWLAPHLGAKNIWLAQTSDIDDAGPLTNETVSSIREIWWSGSSDALIVSKDETGSEQSRLFAFHVSSRRWQRLSPVESAQSRVVAISTRVPDDILLECNGDDPAFFDAWRVNIHTGKAQRILRNDRFTWLHADANLQLRLVETRNIDGSVTFHVPDNEGGWRPLIDIPADDEALTRPFRIYEVPIAFGIGDAEVYARDSRGRDTAALAAWDLDSGSARLIGADDRADVSALVIDAASCEVLAWSSEWDRPEVRVMEGARSAWNDVIESLGPDVWVSSQSADSSRWIIARHAADRPTSYHLFDRPERKSSFLYEERQELATLHLARVTTQIVKSRDGRDLVCYLTWPRNSESGPLPMVALIHGGPWIRDTFSFDPWNQLLANRGYLVLNVNFRGSSGFGKHFLNSGNREWGAAMLDDVFDAVRWAIDAGLAMPEKVAAMGASFGGYSILMGMARAPTLFACGVDIFGVSDLETFLESIPPHWKALKDFWRLRVGDIETPQGRAILRAHSPLHAANAISRPLLIVQGGADPRVREDQSRKIALALEARGVQVTYMLFPNEGHSFYQLANELVVFGAIEAFLARHLGGRVEPFGSELESPEFAVPLGADHIHGLAARAI